MRLGIALGARSWSFAKPPGGSKAMGLGGAPGIFLGRLAMRRRK